MHTKVSFYKRWYHQLVGSVPILCSEASRCTKVWVDIHSAIHLLDMFAKQNIWNILEWYSWRFPQGGTLLRLLFFCTVSCLSKQSSYCFQTLWILPQSSDINSSQDHLSLPTGINWQSNKQSILRWCCKQFNWIGAAPINSSKCCWGVEYIIYILYFVFLCILILLHSVLNDMYISLYFCTTIQIHIK